MTLLIIYLAIAVVVSFICSILEAVLLSITPSFINIKIQQGKKAGKDLKRLKEDIDRPLAAILTLNTFANTAGAAGVGAQAQVVWGNEYLTIVSIGLTLLILFISEIIPKTIGAVYWKNLALFAATILKGMVFILTPVVWISQILTRMFKKNQQRSILSRADFHAITEMGEQSGALFDNESTIIKNLLSFNQVQVKNIMTPRTVVIAAEEDMTLKDFTGKFSELRFSRIPVYKKNIDSVTGFVLKDEILSAMLNKTENMPLKELKRKIDVVPEVVPIPELFKLFLDKNAHIAMVVDEYGGMAGIVTMEDVIETLLGLEIKDEMDKVSDLQQLARTNWEKRARRLGLLNKSK
ncbi:MAG: HlyC/CorC family transporter [Calditrichae bacterium]|nr:HlyC/CorC family transporter [Calditrichota bacterium]MCB9059337.1 HlyC/CorC family transporter [Calditrichia bacterium]